MTDFYIYTTLGKNHLFKNIIKKTSHSHILLYLLYKLLFLLAFSFCEVQYCNSQLLNYNFGRIPWNMAFYSIKLYIKISDELHHELEHWPQLTWPMGFVEPWLCDVMECATWAFYALRCHGMRHSGTLHSMWIRGVVEAWIDMAGGVGCVG